MTHHQQMRELEKELAPIEGEMFRLSMKLADAMQSADTEAIHLSACHAEWSAKRAALIAKFFQEV